MYEAIWSAARYAAVPLPQRPRLAPWVVVVDLGDDRLQLRSAESAWTLTQPLLVETLRRVKPMLDGHHPVEEIAASAGADIQPTTVVFLLKVLRANGVLHESMTAEEVHTDQARSLPAGTERQRTFLSHFGEPVSMQRALRESRIGLAGGDEVISPIEASLRSVGTSMIGAVPVRGITHVDPEDRGIDLLIAVAECPAFSFFQEVNAACLASRTRWMRVALYGTTALVGPTVVPWQTPCYDCYLLRERAQFPERDGWSHYRDLLGTPGSGPGSGVDEGSFPPLWQIVAGHVALETARIVAGFAPPATIGRFFEVRAASPVTVSHDVLRVPRCPSCGRGRVYRQAWGTSSGAEPHH